MTRNQNRNRKTHRFVKLVITDCLEMNAETVPAQVHPILPFLTILPVGGIQQRPTNLGMTTPSGQAIEALRIGQCIMARKRNDYADQEDQSNPSRIHSGLLHLCFTFIFVILFLFICALTNLFSFCQDRYFQNRLGHFTLFFPSHDRRTLGAAEIKKKEPQQKNIYIFNTNNVVRRVYRMAVRLALKLPSRRSGRLIARVPIPRFFLSLSRYSTLRPSIQLMY